MLIKCPECGKEISDKSAHCIHCGFPITNIAQTNICKIGNCGYDLSEELQMVLDGVDKVKVVGKLRSKDLTLKEAVKMYSILNDTKSVPSNFEKEPEEVDTTPKCPTCQSTNLKKISALSKAGSVALWGVLAAGRTSKTWHCNNCGNEW